MERQKDLLNHHRYVEAVPIAEQMLQARLDMKAGEGAQTLSLERCRLHLASLYRGIGRYKDAEDSLKQCLPEDAGKSAGSDDCAAALNGLASLYIVQDRLDEAKPVATRSLALLEEEHGKDGEELLPVLDSLFEIYQYSHLPERAIATAKRSLAIRERLYGNESPKILKSLSNLSLAMIFAKGGEEVAQRKREIEQRGAAKGDILSIVEIASQERSQRHQQKALSVLTNAIERADEKHSNSPSMAVLLVQTGDIYCNQGKFDLADSCYDKSVKIWSERYYSDDAEIADFLVHRSWCEYWQSHQQAADEYFATALEIRRKLPESLRPELRDSLNNLSIFCNDDERAIFVKIPRDCLTRAKIPECRNSP
ncbi:MAG: tetratricopeptide repeat protein [Candidatus Obscuribacterales bacterium]